MRLNLDLGAPSNSLLMVCSMILFAHIALIVECETILWYFLKMIQWPLNITFAGSASCRILIIVF